MTSPGAMLEQLLGAIERQDLAALGALVHEQASFEFPYTDAGVDISRTRGRDAVVAQFSWIFENLFEQVTFTMERLYPGSDPAVGIAEYRSAGRLRSGADYANRYITVIELQDGLISLYREYFNPLAVAAAQGG